MSKHKIHVPIKGTNIELVLKIILDDVAGILKSKIKVPATINISTSSDGSKYIDWTKHD